MLSFRAFLNFLFFLEHIYRTDLLIFNIDDYPIEKVRRKKCNKFRARAGTIFTLPCLVQLPIGHHVQCSVCRAVCSPLPLDRHVYFFRLCSLQPVELGATPVCSCHATLATLACATRIVRPLPGASIMPPTRARTLAPTHTPTNESRPLRASLAPWTHGLASGVDWDGRLLKDA